jgi:hypothetical protein
VSGFPRDALAGARPRDLAWLTGSWHARLGDDRIEEHWSGLGGDMLLGMFRWVRPDGVRFYEIEAIEREAERVVLRVKHFDRGLIGWEERDASHDFVLVESDARGAVFLERAMPDPRWAVYRRRGADRLDAYFTHGTEPDPDPGVFAFTRRR